MKRIGFLLVVVLLVVGVIATMPRTSRAADGKATPVFVTKIVPGYRDWRFISVAHEEGQLNDIRVILGNDTAIKAYRENKLPFPEGTIIARIAWTHVPSEENNKVFGRAQSFVPGDAPEWYLQFMVKDSKQYSATGGWVTGRYLVAARWWSSRFLLPSQNNQETSMSTIDRSNQN